MSKEGVITYTVGPLSLIWVSATILLFCNWFVKSIPSWIVDICNLIFIIGVFAYLILFAFAIFILWVIR